MSINMRIQGKVLHCDKDGIKFTVVCKPNSWNGSWNFASLLVTVNGQTYRGEARFGVLGNSSEWGIRIAPEVFPLVEEALAKRYNRGPYATADSMRVGAQRIQ